MNWARAAPTARAATAPRITDAITAAVPLAKNHGMSGITAPIEKAMNDDTAAPTGEPSSPGSMPSSSRACVSRARSGSRIISRASSSATAASTPRLR